MKIILRTKTNSKLTDLSLLVGIYMMMPIVDSFSGFFHEELPIGQVYRSFICIYVFFLLAKYEAKEFGRIFIAFVGFLGMQMIVSGDYILESFQGVMKLFIPISTLSLFLTLYKKKKIEKNVIENIISFWSVLYPLLIIIPGMLGLGVNAYDEQTGWKGFFYATNEIAFIIVCLTMCQYYKLSKELNIRDVVILSLNAFAALMMGTKAGYLTLACFALFLVGSYLKKRNLNKQLKLWMGICIIVVVVICNIDVLQGMVRGILERWKYQRGFSVSIIDFMFSHRLRRYQNAISIFFSGVYPITGWGMCGDLLGFPNMEMDFFDIMFKTGIPGAIYVLSFYANKIIYVSKKNMWGWIIDCWAFMFCFAAGHVLFYGQSGMMLAILMLYVNTFEKK